MSPSSSPAIERAIRRAPPFPAVARAVLRTVAEPDWSVKELAGVIRHAADFHVLVPKPLVTG